MLVMLLGLVIAVSTSASGADAHECAHLDGCGCALRIEERSCPSGLAHFSHALHDGAPLRFRISGVEIMADSEVEWTGSFSHGEGDSWSERYRAAIGGVELRYQPAPSSCTKESEPCEFFDVRAEILIRPVDHPSYVLQATGVCGC